MKLILDSGALIALERGDRGVWKRFKDFRHKERAVVTHGGVIGQVWRGQGPRQALLATALRSVEVFPLDDVLGRAAGELLDRAKRKDVIDAALVLLASEGDLIVTSDPDDIGALARVAGRVVDLIEV